MPKWDLVGYESGRNSKKAATMSENIVNEILKNVGANVSRSMVEQMVRETADRILERRREERDSAMVAAPGY